VNETRARKPPAARLRQIRAHITPRHLLIANAVVWLLVLVLWQRCGVGGCPNVERLASYQPDGATVLLDRAGAEFADLAPVGHEVVALESLPPHVPAAFIAIEDKRFYEHSGVDVRRVFGALLADIRARAFVQGFSTIPMQLARNVWPDALPGHERTLTRKVLEVRVARAIERRFSKDEILQLYLNHIYFGSGAYGIEAAAHSYFGKSADELLLSEAALLAAIPRSPVLYNPRRYEARAHARRNLVLTMMEAQERIDAREAESARDARMRVRRDPPARTRGQDLIAPNFVEAVRRVLEDRVGEAVYTNRLQVHTTLDPDIQRIAERELKRQLERIEGGSYGRFRRDDPERDGVEPEPLQGAVVVLEAQSGDVRALVGSRDYGESQFDRATRARRQAGSAFKPFVYATALAQGFAPSQQIMDDTLRMELPGGMVWEPQNYSGDFRGFVSLRQALVGSRNVPTIRLAYDVGIDNVARMARRAGVRSDIPDVPSAAIGVAAVTPLELTAAYTAFANLGRAAEPRLVTRVLDEEGGVVWENETETEDVLSPEVAYLVTDMLRDAVDEGTGMGVRDAGFRSAAAGKTGTTDDATDVWFVGYTPDLVASVWVGFDQPRTIVARAAGGVVAAPLWGRIMEQIYRERSTPPEWTVPSGVIERRIDPTTGLVLVEGCRPLRGRARTELFVRGDEPASACPAGVAVADARGWAARAGDWLRRAWLRSTHLLARHFGSEEAQPVPPSGQERYLGTPRLPRAIEVSRPVVEADSFRPDKRVVRDTVLRETTVRDTIPR
jgi:penicillin-binding protein 1A